MIRMNESEQVRMVLQHADTIVNACTLKSSWQGVAVEIANDNCLNNEAFEGTLLYFPGVTLKELKGGV